jgi:hypothetical protein
MLGWLMLVIGVAIGIVATLVAAMAWDRGRNR